jgi:hypothetical protein
MSKILSMWSRWLLKRRQEADHREQTIRALSRMNRTIS